LRQAQHNSCGRWREESRALHQELPDMKFAEARKSGNFFGGITTLGGIR